MLKLENQCVDCGLPCIGNSCRYRNVPVYYCDECGNDNACYSIDGEHYCEDCAKKYLKEVFDDLTLSEQAEVLKILMTDIDQEECV